MAADKRIIVVVTGGRDFNDGEFVWGKLNEFCRKTRIIGLIHGMATGVDTLCGDWMSLRIRREYAECFERRRTTPKHLRQPGIQYHPELWCVGIPARWDDLDVPGAVIRTRRDGARYNILAGPMRNTEMLKWHPQALLRFPGGRGTANMAKQAADAGIPVIEFPAPA